MTFNASPALWAGMAAAIASIVSLGTASAQVGLGQPQGSSGSIAGEPAPTS